MGVEVTKLIHPSPSLLLDFIPAPVCVVCTPKPTITTGTMMKGPRCGVPDCESVASRAPPGSTAGTFCIRHGDTAMINVINWTECSHECCEKYPTYGVEGTSNREFCAEHASSGMVDVHRKKCLAEGCLKRASHGVKGTGRRQFCGQHAPSGMADIGHKFCRFSSEQEGDCESIARYGVRASKKREFCSRHAPDGMVNMNDKLCVHGDCPKLPTYGQQGTKVRQFCSQHAPEGAVNVTHKICAEPSCCRQPTYGVPGSRKRVYCRRHALDGMTDMAHKTCARPTCNKHPKYGIQGGNRREFCALHATAGMVHMGNKKCVTRGCQRRPDHGDPGSAKPEYCAQHARLGMVKVCDVLPAKPLSRDGAGVHTGKQKHKASPFDSSAPKKLKARRKGLVAPNPIPLPMGLVATARTAAVPEPASPPAPINATLDLVGMHDLVMAPPSVATAAAAGSAPAGGGAALSTAAAAAAVEAADAISGGVVDGGTVVPVSQFSHERNGVVPAELGGRVGDGDGAGACALRVASGGSVVSSVHGGADAGALRLVSNDLPAAFGGETGTSSTFTSHSGSSIASLTADIGSAVRLDSGAVDVSHFRSDAVSEFHDELGGGGGGITVAVLGSPGVGVLSARREEGDRSVAEVGLLSSVPPSSDVLVVCAPGEGEGVGDAGLVVASHDSKGISV